ncbi:MAG: type II secretion system protein M [Gammaproteobacteria bacterium]|nr:type II secretion system protein M [Gammaproteobacteria bacterium]
MLNYWRQLKPRERMLVSVGGVFVGAMMLYLLLLEPLTDKAEQLESRVASQQKEVQWLKQAATEVAALKKTQPGNAGNARRGQSLLVLVDSTAKQNKLADSMKRVEPDGTQRVRVWLENVAFDEVTKWMGELELRYQIQVESAVLDKTETTGLVNARLVLLGSES